MLGNLLWLSLLAAIGMGGYALVETQSVLIALAAYSGAGMAVLFAALGVDAAFGGHARHEPVDEAFLKTNPHG